MSVTPCDNMDFNFYFNQLATDIATSPEGSPLLSSSIYIQNICITLYIYIYVLHYSDILLGGGNSNHS